VSNNVIKKIHMKSTAVALFLSLGLTTALTACGDAPAVKDKGATEKSSTSATVTPGAPAGSAPVRSPSASPKEGGEGDEKGAKDKKKS
jgi:hypothetical protein